MFRMKILPFPSCFQRCSPAFLSLRWFTVRLFPFPTSGLMLFPEMVSTFWHQGVVIRKVKVGVSTVSMQLDAWVCPVWAFSWSSPEAQGRGSSLKVLIPMYLYSDTKKQAEPLNMWLKLMWKNIFLFQYIPVWSDVCSRWRSWGSAVAEESHELWTLKYLCLIANKDSKLWMKDGNMEMFSDGCGFQALSCFSRICAAGAAG